MKEGILLKDFVKSACDRLGLEFDDIREVKMNHPTDPTHVLVYFNFDDEPMEIEISRPLSA
jgi:hypothetical protein